MSHNERFIIDPAPWGVLHFIPQFDGAANTGCLNWFPPVNVLTEQPPDVKMCSRCADVMRQRRGVKAA